VASLVSSASAETVYDNTPTPQPGNVSSWGYEATQTSEFGGQIQLAGTARANPTISVLMSSWGCQTGHWYSNDCVTTPGATFSHPLTVKVYAVGPGNAPGALLASQNKTFAIPYRPTASGVCGDGRWSDGTNCFNGKAVNLAFNPLGVTLPSNVIVSVAYNTTHYGANPIGASAPCYTSSAGCGYDSLNVGLWDPPTVGSTPLPADAYLNSATPGQYCDLGSGGSGTFCWGGFQPAIQVDAPIGPPTNKDQCKDDGWKAFDTPRKFKNQGDCVSFVANGK
jgi:hypothetical protein